MFEEQWDVIGYNSSFSQLILASKGVEVFLPSVVLEDVGFSQLKSVCPLQVVVFLHVH